MIWSTMVVSRRTNQKDNSIAINSRIIRLKIKDELT